jgi:hypothetical protein
VVNQSKIKSFFECDSINSNGEGAPR